MRREAKRSTKQTICALAAFCVALFAMSASAQAARPVLQGTFSCAAKLAVKPAPPEGQNCGGVTETSFTPVRSAVNEATGDLYVLDAAPDKDAIRVFDKDGTYKKSIGLPGDKGPAADGSFGLSGMEEYSDIAVDNSGTATQGRIYVASALSRTFGFDADGTFDWEQSTSNGCGIGVDTAGNLYLGEFENGVKQLKADDGTLLGTIAGPDDGLNDACNLAFDSEDNLYIRHLNPNTVEKRLAGSYKTPVTTLADAGHTDVEVNRTTNRVYTVSSGVSLRWYDEDIQPIVSPFDSGASGRNYRGVTVNSKTGRVYVTDEANGRIEVWEHIVPLEVAETGTGSGAVQCDSGTGPEACAAEYLEGTKVTVTATADVGSAFKGFAADGSASACTASTLPCTFTLTEKTKISAKFDQVKHELTVEKSGNGKVLSEPAGISCGSTCKAKFIEGTSVTLSAEPEAGNKFSGWSGCDSEAAGKCTVAIDAALKVTASFVAIPKEEPKTNPPVNNPPVVIPPPPPPVNQLGPCIAKANKAFNAAMKAAGKKKGKAKAKAIKAAKAKKAKATKACKAQFA